MTSRACCLLSGPCQLSSGTAADQKQSSGSTAAQPSPDILWLCCRVQQPLPPSASGRVSAGADLGINCKHWRSVYIATLLSQMQGHFFFPPVQEWMHYKWACVFTSACVWSSQWFTAEEPEFALSTDKLKPWFCIGYPPRSRWNKTQIQAQVCCHLSQPHMLTSAQIHACFRRSDCLCIFAGESLLSVAVLTMYDLQGEGQEF